MHIYSRDLHDVSDGYPEVIAVAGQQAWDGILDGELLAFRDGMALPFVQLQARLGRKSPSIEIQSQVPVIYVAFDLLAHGAGGGASVEPLLRLGLDERRRRLDALGLPKVPGMATSNVLSAATTDELGRIFDAAQQRGNEGLMVKDPASTYTPGRRGYGWLKLKRPLATLDCVVVGVEVGHGKRHGVLSDYTFAVRDDRPDGDGRLVTIGKAYSGLTDAELAEMTAWFEAHTVQPDRTLPRGRADDRGRDRLRRDPPLKPPRVGLRAAFPAHLPPPAGQAHARDRHDLDGRDVLPAARNRAQVQRPDDQRGATGMSVRRDRAGP